MQSMKKHCFDFSDDNKSVATNLEEMQQYIAHRNKTVHESFLRTAAEIGWHLISQDEGFQLSNLPYAIVIGCPSWDTYALESLGIFAERTENKNLPIHIFDFDKCLSMKDIRHFMPGIDEILSTPVIAEYCSGKLIRFAQGYEANKWLREI